MTIEPLEETLAVPKMDEDELEDVDQPIVSLQPLDMAPCKILLSLPQEILPSDRQAIQEVLRVRFLAILYRSCLMSCLECTKHVISLFCFLLL